MTAAFRLVLLTCALLSAAAAAADGDEPPQSGQEADPVGVLSEPDPLFDDEPDPLFDTEDEEPSGSTGDDPFEGLNRGVLVFNQGLDRWIFDPITRAYRFVVPEPARRSVRRAFLNVGSAPILVNDVLQLEWIDAGVTLSRFVVNSTVGLAGLFDPAASIGLGRHESDFGQTLALAGIDSGPYLVLPVFGPSTVRDGAGQVTDTFMNPSAYFFGFGLFEVLLYGGSAGLTTRDAHFEELKALESSSIEFYSALRSAFTQNRQADIWARREYRRNDWVDTSVY